MKYIKDWKIFENNSESIILEMIDIIQDIKDTSELYCRLDMGEYPGNDTNMLEPDGFELNRLGVQLLDSNLKIAVPIQFSIQSDEKSSFKFEKIKYSIEHLISYMESNGFKCETSVSRDWMGEKKSVDVNNLRVFKNLFVVFYKPNPFFLYYLADTESISLIVSKNYKEKFTPKGLSSIKINQSKFSWQEVSGISEDLINKFRDRKLNIEARAWTPDGDFDRFQLKKMGPILIFKDNIRDEECFRSRTTDRNLWSINFKFED